MKKEQLTYAMKLNEEIKELENFLYAAEKVWTGKVNLKSIIANAYGCFNQQEYNMNTKVKSKVLNVLQEYLKELKTKMESI